MSLHLRYSFDGTTLFEESIDLSALPPPSDDAQRQAVEGLLSCLAIVAGTSYYKAAAPAQIAVDFPVSQAVLDFGTMVYRHGLAEFAYVNRLPGVLEVSLTAESIVPGRDPLHLDGRDVLVPVGGGKDSIVTLEMLKSSGVHIKAFSVGGSKPAQATADVAGVEMLAVRRRIDPVLLELNQSGAYNGHIPVTAINSLLALIAAVLTGCHTVAMSNEWSASVATTAWQGSEINHQWSKGIAFEHALSGLVHDTIAADLDYVSLLRPLSEFAIARQFSGHPRYFEKFMSCNRYYRMSGNRASWCCECDKCRFVFLILAPWLNRAQMTEIFGANLLEDTANLPGFRKLAGLAGERPFDCVGEAGEVVAAFMALQESAEWKDARVVVALGKEIAEIPGAAAAFDQALVYHDSGMPEQYEKVLRAAL